jgi:hypothetical protein
VTFHFISSQKFTTTGCQGKQILKELNNIAVSLQINGLDDELVQYENA